MHFVHFYRQITTFVFPRLLYQAPIYMTAAALSKSAGISGLSDSFLLPHGPIDCMFVRV